MTSAKLSAGDDERDQMSLSGITDACRRYGAIIVSGHHHLYSRTKVLESVGDVSGEDPIPVGHSNHSSISMDEKNASIIREGLTLSLTVGMGGYDSSCDGKYVNASWMATCVASLREHRGAVIAQFDPDTPWTGTFQYLNSLDNAAVVDEFVLTSRLPGWNNTITTTNASVEIEIPSHQSDGNEESDGNEVAEVPETEEEFPVSSVAPSAKFHPSGNRSMGRISFLCFPMVGLLLVAGGYL